MASASSARRRKLSLEAPTSLRASNLAHPRSSSLVATFLAWSNKPSTRSSSSNSCARGIRRRASEVLRWSIEPPAVSISSTWRACSGETSLSMIRPQMERRRPPSTAKLTPRIPPEAGRQRKVMALAVSNGSMRRWIGTWSSQPFLTSSADFPVRS